LPAYAYDKQVDVVGRRYLTDVAEGHLERLAQAVGDGTSHGLRVAEHRLVDD